MGMNVRQINAGRSFTVNVMSALPAPSSTILTASSDSILRYLTSHFSQSTLLTGEPSASFHSQKTDRFSLGISHYKSC